MPNQITLGNAICSQLVDVMRDKYEPNLILSEEDTKIIDEALNDLLNRTSFKELATGEPIAENSGNSYTRHVPDLLGQSGHDQSTADDSFELI